MEFQTQYKFMPSPGEKNSGKSIVDPSGYVDAKTRIENLMRAGERLDEYRREMYQYGPDEDPNDESSDDVTMAPGFDLADAHYLRQKALGRLRRQASEPSVKPTEPKAASEVKQAEAKEAEDGPTP